jgi:hypothetical protein
VADNGNTVPGNTVSEYNGPLHFMATGNGAIPPSTRAEKMTDGIVGVYVDGSSETIPALPSPENENNEAGINISKEIGNVSLVDAGVEYHVRCQDEEEILEAETPQANTGQEFDSATWRIATRKCSVPPRQLMLRPPVLTSNKFAPLQGLHVDIMSRKAPVPSAGLMQTDPPLTNLNQAVQSVFVSKQTILSAAALQREPMSGVDFQSSSLSTTVCLHSSALSPASVAWERLDSAAELGGNPKAQILILSCDRAEAGGTTQMAQEPQVLRGNIWK